MANIRNRTHPNGFTVLDNRGINCPDISFRALGLWAYIKSKPDNWEVSVIYLAKQKKREGRDAIYKAMTELIEAGLVVKTQSRVDGKFKSFDYDFYDFPQNSPLPEKPFPEKPYPVKPLPENPPQVNKDQLTTDQLTTDPLNYSEREDGFEAWLRMKLKEDPNVRSVDAVAAHVLKKGKSSPEYQEFLNLSKSDQLINDVLEDLLCLT